MGVWVLALIAVLEDAKLNAKMVAVKAAITAIKNKWSYYPSKGKISKLLLNEKRTEKQKRILQRSSKEKFAHVRNGCIGHSYIHNISIMHKRLLKRMHGILFQNLFR